jgi:LemA protein
MKIGLVLLLVAIILVSGGQYAGIRSRLVVERESIVAAWAQVDLALEHRADLVPSLVEEFQSEAPGEQSAVKAVTDARATLDAAHGPQQKIQASGNFENAIARLLLASESYPKLDKSKKFGNLQEALREAEYQLDESRRKYNEAVEHYNTNIALFPKNIVASLAGFHKIDTYYRTLPEPSPASKGAN